MNAFNVRCEEMYELGDRPCVSMILGGPTVTVPLATARRLRRELDRSIRTLTRDAAKFRRWHRRRGRS